MTTTPAVATRPSSGLGLAYAAFAMLVLVWGSNFIFVKWAALSISPSQIVFLRVFFGFLPLLATAVLTGAVHWRHWHHAHHSWSCRSWRRPSITSHSPRARC